MKSSPVSLDTGQVAQQLLDERAEKAPPIDDLLSLLMMACARGAIVFLRWKSYLDHKHLTASRYA
ncbi:hypothetical protein [uncultured Cohaesibacter sp.]|uniref:hypothetical protein n=1 Tax=uncultured Cohaesibacter sp. TaxID=1002546 RepID=UPI0029C8A7E1|nr:hypothetical protein [uncultured Cohaesibacter sp.]